MPDTLFFIGILIILYSSSLFFFHKRSLRYLQYFQQEEYEGGRFFRWYVSKGAFDTRATPLLIVSLVILILPIPFSALLSALYTSAILLFVCLSEEDPLKAGKLRLKMTQRASRIHKYAICYYAITLAFVAYIFYTFFDSLTIVAFIVVQFLFIQSTPLWLILSKLSLDPQEKSIQEGFANQARDVIKEYQPTIVGITGSYGKTSTKILLKDILGSVYPTFSTPGSVNTYMGVTRKIREEMNSSHKFAVIEMGAYYKGSITRMCSLTPPKAALVTIVGLAHLERFGSQENIYHAKSELPQAVPDDGIIVVNGDYEYTRRMAKEHKKKTTLLYGMEQDKGHLDCIMSDITYSEEGTNFTITWKGEEYKGFTKLLGRPNLENVLGAFTMACALGTPCDVALASIRNAKAESNRLELQKTHIGNVAITNGKAPRDGQIVKLNDAYNSNPLGFKAALDVLSHMPGGRKVLVTPGMIELGEKQYEENQEAGKQAAKICDLVLVVGGTNKDALVDGLKAGGLEESKLKEFPLMADALSYLATDYLESGDVMLIENDLPDLYEGVVKF